MAHTPRKCGRRLRGLGHGRLWPTGDPAATLRSRPPLIAARRRWPGRGRRHTAPRGSRARRGRLRPRDDVVGVEPQPTEARLTVEPLDLLGDLGQVLAGLSGDHAAALPFVEVSGAHSHRSAARQSWQRAFGVPGTQQRDCGRISDCDPPSSPAAIAALASEARRRFAEPTLHRAWDGPRYAVRSSV